MATSTRRSRTRSTRPRRKLIWARKVIGSTIIGAATGRLQVDLLEDFRNANGGAMPIGSTITRVRMDIEYGSDDVTLTQAIASGLIVDTIAEPASELPDPRITEDPFEDWMWWRYLYCTPKDQLVNPTTQTLGYQRIEVDVRSQRRCEELGQTLYAIFSNTHPTVGVQLGLAASVLLKLP